VAHMAHGRYGFRNPDEVWDRPGTLGAVIIGDSFAEGACVLEDKHVAGQIRKEFPGMVTLGRGSGGPLFELAILREYTSARQVGVIFWMFYEEWDLQDIQGEFRHPTLLKYRDTAFTQDLARRTRGIDLALRNFIDEKLAHWPPAANYNSKSRLALHRVTARLTSIDLVAAWRRRNASSQPLAEAQYPDDSFQKMDEVMRFMVAEAGKESAKLVVVYLVRHPAYSGGREVPAQGKARVFELANSYGISVIDTGQALARLGNLRISLRSVFPTITTAGVTRSLPKRPESSSAARHRRLPANQGKSHARRGEVSEFPGAKG